MSEPRTRDPAERLRSFLDRTPYARFLGVRAELAGDEMTAVLPFQDKLIGTGLREVQSTRVGELVMRELKRLDKVAYVRFASVYRSFEDVDEFSRLIKDI